MNIFFRSQSLKLILASTITTMSSLVFPTPSLAQVCSIYVVGVQGIVASPFNREGFQGTQYAIIRNPGYRGNPIDFRLTNGADINNGLIGQIEISTNSASASNLGRRSQRANLARVSIARNNIVSATLIPEANFALPPVNAFVAPGPGTAPGGLGGLNFLPGAGGQIGRIISGAFVLSRSFYIPVNGGVQFGLSPDGRAISGRVDTLGVQIDNFSNQARYTSNFGGRFWTSTRCP